MQRYLAPTDRLLNLSCRYGLVLQPVTTLAPVPEPAQFEPFARLTDTPKRTFVGWRVP
jgi:hypothetical protein